MPKNQAGAPPHPRTDPKEMLRISVATVTSNQPVAASRASIRARIAIAAITVCLSAAMLLVHLGHYSLWDDEALVALTAQGVWKTGDTTEINGKNIVAYHSGLILKNFKDRYSPPLQFYVVAPFVGLFGNQSWAARLPMALMGLPCIALMLWWLWVDEADIGLWVILALALLGNVSFFLYFRQCRYYGPAMVLLTAVGFLYMHLSNRRRVVLLSVALILLLTTIYMSYAACVVALSVDYLFWGRKRRHFDRIDWAVILVPQLVFGLLVIWIWNPLSIHQAVEDTPWLQERIQLLWWNVRDLNTCEFVATIPLLAAPVVAILTRRTDLLRAVVALAINIVVITLVSPQTIRNTKCADIRYMSGAIPLCIAIEAVTLRALCGRWIWIAGVPAACVLFGTNLLQGGVPLDPRWVPSIRSTVWLYFEELADPPPDPYTAAAAWINANVPEDDSIWVLPDYMCYPLMFHAPKAVYAWQFKDASNPEYVSLPAINFNGRVPPDYIIIFGGAAPSSNSITLGGVVTYSLAATLNVYGRDLFRPELQWRIFRPIGPFDPASDGIRIYAR